MNKTTQAKKEESLEVCSKDYKNRHYWQLMGVINYDYILYKCSQCGKCKLSTIKYIQGNHTE